LKRRKERTNAWASRRLLIPNNATVWINPNRELIHG
jgi:hypothetical protein